MTPSLRSEAKTVRSVTTLLFSLLISLVAMPSIAIGAEAPATPAGARSGLSYADVADLVTRSDIAAKLRVDGVSKVELPPSAGDTAPRKYLLVRGRIESLIRGENGIAPTVSYLVREADASPGGKRVKRKQQLMVFALRTAKTDSVRLASRHAQQLWTPELDAHVRAIAGEMAGADAPAALTGIGDAFHSAGTVAEEGETQIFLKTANGDPVSLSVVRRPGQPPKWGVALGEIVDETAVPPQGGTLLWYRLACGLPARLPPESLGSLAAGDVEAARRDYQFILDSLGRCGRTV